MAHNAQEKTVKLLLISSDREDAIDQILVVVPDDADLAKVLDEAEHNLGGDCSIDANIDLGDEAKYLFSQYRMYVG